MWLSFIKSEQNIKPWTRWLQDTHIHINMQFTILIIFITIKFGSIPFKNKKVQRRKSKCIIYRSILEVGTKQNGEKIQINAK